MKLLSGLIILFAAVSSVSGQEWKELITQYLFPEFYKGKVLLKTGVIKETKLNYNSLTEEMIFETNGKYLALANLDLVDTVYIQNRKFIPSGKLFYEVPVNVKVPLLIRHTARIIPPGTPAAFGGTSETSSATVINTLYQTGRAYEMKLSHDYKITTTTSSYLKTDDNVFMVNNVKQLIKCFPLKEAEIKEFIKKNRTDFDKEEDLTDLIVFCNKK